MNPNAFPIFLACIDVMAAVCYSYHRDGWRACYWMAAAFLTYSTTRMGH